MDSSCVVYWEQQGANRLCAVHCANAILQGPRLKFDDLLRHAQELDAKERELLGIAGGEVNGSPPASQNWDRSGNFSLGVLQKALMEAAGIELVYVDRGDVNRDTSRESGFLANSHAREHWFAVRRVRGRWWDLDSLRSAPREISEAELSSNLEDVRGRGFTVFAVRPSVSSIGGKESRMELPEPEASASGAELEPHQHFLTEEQVRTLAMVTNKPIGVPTAEDLEKSDSNLQPLAQVGQQELKRRILMSSICAVVVLGAIGGVVAFIVSSGGSVG